jgi:metal-responsive CopG/Arc/MetJ family transcriptional regulator
MEKLLVAAAADNTPAQCITKVAVSVPTRLLVEVDRTRHDISRSRFVVRALEHYMRSEKS